MNPLVFALVFFAGALAAFVGALLGFLFGARSALELARQMKPETRREPAPPPVCNNCAAGRHELCTGKTPCACFDGTDMRP
jgi:hypothetical protein